MSAAAPVVLVGCGRLGSAIVEGWLATGAVPPERLIILTPSPKPVSDRAAARGARVNPPDAAVREARAVVLAVKPALWRAVAAELTPRLAEDAVIVSVMAGTPLATLAEAFAPRPAARVMPTTAVAQAMGVAALWAQDGDAAAAAHALFDPVADLVELDAESQMDAATGVAGCGPAFVYRFVQALAEAGVELGLDPAAATRLARGALRSAAAGLDTGEGLEALIDRIASPGGVTRAGLDAMAAGGRMDDLARATLAAALRREREVAAS